VRFALSPAKPLSPRQRVWRVLLLVVVTGALCSLGWWLLASRRAPSRPVIERLTPNIGSVGDRVRIDGRGFGTERGLGYVEFDGLPVTAAAYLRWSDEQVEFTVPPLTASGLVRLVTDEGSSNGRVFVSQSQLPTAPAGQLAGSVGPVISTLSAESGTIGSLLTIRGLNFGVNRDDSAVLFTWAGRGPLASPNAGANLDFVSPSERDGEYELWSDKEIRVRVPDGAASGGLAVRTARGTSPVQFFELVLAGGSRQYGSPRTYALNHFVRIHDIAAMAPNSLYVWLANPVASATQRAVQAIDRTHQPLVADFNGLSVFRLVDIAAGDNLLISQNHVLQCHAFRSEITPQAIRPAPEPLPAVYQLYTQADAVTPADERAVKQLARQAVGRETNPYRVARLVFDAVLARFNCDYVAGATNLEAALESGAASPLLLNNLFVAALRAEGLPARQVAGAFFDEYRKAWGHQWAEFYLYGFGWVPVDIVLVRPALNLPFVAALGDLDAYFGSLDDRHVAYSRGAVPVVPMTPDGQRSSSRLVYSLQSVTEEIAGGVNSYTAVWSDIELTGYY